MGKKKSQTQSTATYGNVAHSATADENAWRNSIQNVDFHTPIANAYGQAENDVNDTTFEDTLPAGVAERIKYGRMFDLRQRKGAALGQAASQEAAFKSGQQGHLAELTQNPFVQTGGSSNSTVSDPWGTGIQIANVAGNA